MTLLDDICIGGTYHFKAAMLLRESKLVNGMLTNSEVWYNLTENDLRELEEIDEDTS